MIRGVVSFSVEDDNSNIHFEGHKARITGGKLKRKAEVNFCEDKFEIKIKPKCSK